MFTFHKPVGRIGRLTLLVAMLMALGLLAGRTASPVRAATIPVSTCDEASLNSAISSASPGDTIAFGCSGDIKLTKTLTISQDLDA